MAEYTTLLDAIRAEVYENDSQAITGQGLQDVLVEMTTTEQENIEAVQAVAEAKADKTSYQQMAIAPTAITLAPNEYVNCGEITELTVTLAEAEGLNTVDSLMYGFGFSSGDTAPTLTLPSSVSFPAEPTFEANYNYQVSIFENIALVVGAPKA